MPHSRANSGRSDARPSSPPLPASDSNDDEEHSDRDDSGSDDEHDVSENDSVRSSDGDGSEVSRRSPADQGSQDNEEARSSSSQSNRSGSAEDQEKVPAGLIVEDKADYLTTGDLVIVHGIAPTPWSTDPVPDTGGRGSTAWLWQYAGYQGWQFLSYFYNLKSTEMAMPALWYRDGIEKEATRLLDALVEWRKGLASQFGEKEANSRPVNFVAHDVGGAIVKKALTIASLNPAKYGNIPYCTTTLVFLGCPHRGTAHELRATLTKLLYLPDDQWHSTIHSYVENVAEMVEQTNGEFSDTNMLIRAGVFNIYNQDDMRTQAPFAYDTVILDTPWEFNKLCSIPHLQLVEGGYLSSEKHDDNYALVINEEKDAFPTRTSFFDDDMNLHRLFLSLAPPCLPAQPLQFRWQPYLIEDWFVAHEKYKEWHGFPGMAILHAHANTALAVKSQEIYAQLQGRELLSNMMYFEFRRHDLRFNNVDTLLHTFIAHISTRISLKRFPGRTFCVSSLLIWRYTPPMIFMIACLDECDSSRNSLLGLIYSLRESTEMRHCFVITSLPEESLMTRLQGSFTINLEDFDTSTQDAWVDTFEKRYERELTTLPDTHPVYKGFMPHIREILAACGTDYRLGSLIVDWLSMETKRRRRDTLIKAERTISSLEPVTENAVLETIISSFGPDSDRARLYLDWISVACRPLTLCELGTAVDFTESPDPATLDFLDLHNTREEVACFGRVLYVLDNTVDFWLPYFAERSHYDADELERAHGRIASACLDYLRVAGVIKMAEEFCDRFTEVDSVCPFPPKDTLFSYAAQYWVQHYSKAGEYRPSEKAEGFFQDPTARNTWWRVSNLLAGPLRRSSVSYLSALPVVAATGLVDLVESQLSLESESPTLEDDLKLAFLEATRHGHVDAMAVLTHRVAKSKKLLTQALEHAASCESLDGFRAILNLASSSDIEIQPPSGLLCRTAWLGWTEITKELFDMLVAQDRKPEFDIEPLHLVVEQGDEALVELVMEWTEDINSRDTWGRTALHIAASAGTPAIINLLVSNGAEVDARLEVDDSGALTPLQLAAASGNHLVIDALLDPLLAKADPNEGADDRQGCVIGKFYEAPPLVYAAAMDFENCVKALIKRGANLTATVDGCTALWWALDQGRSTIARLLLEAGASPDENPEKQDHDMLLLMAISRNNVPHLDLLLEYKADVNQQSSWNTDRRTPLAKAAGEGNLEIVEKLLEKGADPSLIGKDSQPPLYVSAYENHSDISNLLIEKGADIHQAVPGTKWTALHAAHDEPDLVKTLLEKGADIDALSDSGTCLYLASKHNQISVVKLLIEQGAQLDIPTKRISKDLPDEEVGMTALCVALLKGNESIIAALVEAGADVNWMVKDEKTGEDRTYPLMLALTAEMASYATTSPVEVLLEAKANVKHTVGGASILHCLTSTTQVNCVRALHSAGADVNVVDKDENTPLIIALNAPNTPVASYLISVGADVDYFSTRHGTPLHIACKTANWECFSDLIRKGADVSRADQADYRSTLLGALAESNENWYQTERIARHLLEKEKLDPNAKCKKQPYYPLCRVEWESSPALGDYLIDHGANLDPEDEAWGLRPVHFAAWWSLSRYKELLDKGAKERTPRNKAGMTPWHYAAAGGELRTEIEETFGDARIAIRDEDVDGWNALLWATRSVYLGDKEELLLKGGRDLLWHNGYVSGDRLWSPLKLARYMDAVDSTIPILTPRDDERKRRLESGKEEEWEDDAHESRKAARKDQDCFMCLTSIFGYVYHCNICDTDLCFKCVRSKELFDPGHEYIATGYEFLDEANNTDRDGTASDAEKTSAVDEASSVAGSDDVSDDEDEDSASDQDESSADDDDD
ncbi:ankyrin repeats (3 copies) domain-containing protein [Sarocladium implicatum]|nr:ankyrin repeats (3 copies) domain-containing protein [Sarocladium implicatum]